MKITIVAAGKIKEKYLSAGIAEFTKRLTPYCRLNVIEIDEEKMPETPSAAEKAKALAREGERLLKQVPGDSYLIVLDVAGPAASSEELAAKFSQLALNGQSNITFAVGGAFGLSPDIKSAARETLSFSKMTFTHQMIRLLLVEQIYRAFKINRGEPYHW
ncbi:23S rRNA (pseudouridine(1915)-N(3))-methyltransferase RlmH|uniref:Ribosomal RNA large subunit methyltransferase H n=1 Tax=Dendrosporobacter quercicolus TaxID=146817 RepID=A0A1G9TR64_9FIRM|nr:23S rRNA (pseudouridine(1915)-N(3))-methyltransferase RlmH [Dendrosporobacter quercicolus]NSL48896.1 23S rRNA (pseudouridine(1915)-N(3))-methyltransferase RlmH [Dendrosporobacter quercicolus DSM 1736]SDM49605.1 23S rRNA (pseudouridine1915-N3)-methyltransferase [Dendrosporobacter quercicolus]